MVILWLLALKLGQKPYWDPFLGVLCLYHLVQICKKLISQKSAVRLYTVKRYLWVPRSDQAEIRIMRSFLRGDFNRAIRSIGTVFIKFLGNYPQVCYGQVTKITSELRNASMKNWRYAKCLLNVLSSLPTQCCLFSHLIINRKREVIEFEYETRLSHCTLSLHRSPQRPQGNKYGG